MTFVSNVRVIGYLTHYAQIDSFLLLSTRVENYNEGELFKEQQNTDRPHISEDIIDSRVAVLVENHRSFDIVGLQLILIHLYFEKIYTFNSPTGMASLKLQS